MATTGDGIDGGTAGSDMETAKGGAAGNSVEAAGGGAAGDGVDKQLHLQV